MEGSGFWGATPAATERHGAREWASDGERLFSALDSARRGTTATAPMEIALLTALALVLVACAWLLRERYRLAAAKTLAEGRQSDLEATRTAFQALASETLRHSNEEFLRLAQTAFAVQRSEASAELEREDALEPARELRRGG